MIDVCCAKHFQSGAIEHLESLLGDLRWKAKLGSCIMVNWLQCCCCVAEHGEKLFPSIPVIDLSQEWGEVQGWACKNVCKMLARENYRM